MSEELGPAADPRQRGQKKTRDKIREANFGQAFVEVTSSRAGRRVLWSVIERSHVLEDGVAADDRAQARLAGRRSIGLMVLKDWLEHSPASFLEALTESRAEERSADGRRSGSSDGGGAGGEAGAGG